MTARSQVALIFGFAAVAHLSATDAGAQSGLGQRTSRQPSARPAPPEESAESSEFRSRFGVDRVHLLLRGSGDREEQLRGVLRAATIGSPEAIQVLVRASEPTGIARTDPLILLEVVRGLAAHVDQGPARTALLALLNAPIQMPPRAAGSTGSTPSPAVDEDSLARVELARDSGTIALARSADARAIEGLITIARSAGPAQRAAQLALEAFPPEARGLLNAVTLTSPLTVRIAAQSGDLRVLESLIALGKANDPAVRAEAIVALGRAGDERGLGLARSAVQDADPRVQRAAAETLARLGATKEASLVVEALINDSTTANAGVELAPLVNTDGVARALAARVLATANRASRAAAIDALTQLDSSIAIQALATFANSPDLTALAHHALGRSRAKDATTTLEKLRSRMGQNPNQSADARLLARAYLVHRSLSNARSTMLDSLTSELRQSKNVDDVALGVFGKVLDGEMTLADGLAHKDAKVRRAAAMAALGNPNDATLRRLRDAWLVEKDPLTRTIFATGFLADREGRISSEQLAAIVSAGGADAAVAAYALASRFSENTREDVAVLLRSANPLVRSHAARGLGRSAKVESIGLLAAAYRYETETDVRRALVSAIVTLDPNVPNARETLVLAARMDPDGWIRQLAARGRTTGTSSPLFASGPAILGWIQLEGGGADFSGTVVRGDGMALPIAFDGDGFALIPGLSPGHARLVLAPRAIAK